MKKLLLLFTIILSYSTVFSQGSESFANIPTSSSGSYLSRSWTGDDAVTWTATNARTDQTLTSKAICTNGSGTVTSPSYSGGMGVLSFNYVRAFTGTSARSFEVWVNGFQIGGTTTVSSTSNTVVAYSATINVSGSVSVEIRTFGAQIKIDDILWTAYAGSTPTITVTPTSLTGLNYVFGAGPSLGQSYSVSAINLTPSAGNITITAPTNFSVSTTLGGTYTSSLTLAYTGGTLAATDVFVRLNSGLAVATYGPLNVTNAGGGATTMNVAVTGTVSSPPPPTIVATPTSITGLNYIFGAGPSVGQSYSVSASNLTPAAGNITVTAPTNFSVSTTLGGTYTSSLTLAYTGGTLAATNVFVRLNSGLSVATYGPVNVANAGGGATTVNVAVTGTVAPAPPSNNICSAATPLTVGSSCSFTSYTNLNATNSGAPTPGCGSYSGGDVWFSLLVPASGELNIEAAANGGFTDGAMALYSGTCGSLTLIECDDDDGAGSMPQILRTGLTPGSTVYLVFWKFGGGTGGTFNLCAWTPPACVVPTNQATALNFSGQTFSSINVSFTAASPAANNYLVVRRTVSSLSANPVDGSSYTVGATLGGGTVVYNGSGTSFTDVSLSPLTTYYYFVFAYNNIACSGGPIYKTPALTGSSATIAGPCLSDDFNSGYGNWSGGSGTYQNTTAGVTGNGTGFNDNNDDIITSAPVTNPSSISFSARASGTTSDFSVRVQYSTSASGPWTDAAVIVANGSNTGDITNVFSPFNLTLGLSGSLYLRIVQSPRVGGSFYLDDVNVYCGAGCTPPVTQVSGAIVNNPSNSTLDIAWTVGSGTNSLVVVKAGSAVTNVPTAGSFYVANTTFGSGFNLGASEYVVYNGTGSSLTLTGLNQSTTYHVAIFSFNSADSCYNQVGASVADGTTLCNATPNNVTGFTTSTCANGQVTLNWTNPSVCWDNVLVFASENTCTTNTPTGNGAAYSPADTVFGMGDDDLETGVAYLVYKGTGNSVTITGLTNGQTYCFKIFTRNGTNWSSGVEVSCAPSIVYCSAASTNTANEYIEGVELNTINNISGATTYSDYTSVSTTLERGDSYNLVVYVGDYFATDSCLAWIDWNFDGVFDPVTEKVMDAYGSAPFTSVVTVPLGASLSTTTMRIRLYDSNAGTQNATPCGTHTYGEVEDYSITIIEACVPTHTVSSYAPISGPIGTNVFITGTGFTDSTSVNINGISAAVTYINATSISAQVPSGNVDGDINVLEASCDVQAGTFSLISFSGACGASSSFTDLIISEIYDADAANVFYVELYNPTTSPIDLDAGGADYGISIDNRNSGDPGISIDRTIDISGVVPAGGTFLLNLGTSSNTCSKTWNFSSGGGGINAHDYVFLTLNGSNVDRVNLASQTGYTFKRNVAASGPTTTYASGDWDILLTEDCSDLGVFGLPISPSPTLSNLVNFNACDFLLGTVVTEGDLGTLGDVTFQWYYNDGISAGWSAVSSSSPANLTITGETNDTLIIANGSASLASISGFQFYCEVNEATSCENVSNAAKFEFKPEPYFRTKGAGASQGAWSDVSLWEMSSDLVAWSSACVYPTASNSDTIIIQALDSIAIVEGMGAPDVIGDQIYVAPTGILLIDESAEFHLENGTLSGADILIDGVLIDKASSGLGNGLNFIGGSSWALGSNGTVIKTYSSSVNDYRDNYETGIANIPATAHWAYVNLGQGSIAVSAIDMFYPNLYFESVSGNYDASGFGEVLRGTSGFTTVKGDLSVGLGTITAGTGTYKVYNNNFNAQEMIILGDVYIGPGSEFTNASYNGSSSSSHDNGTGIEVKGSFAIDGILNMNAGSGRTFLSGASKQDIVSASGTGTFDTYDFEIDNTAHAELLDIDVNISNNLTFTNGKIITDVANSDMVFVQNSSISAIVGGVTSGADKYIEGKLQWTTDGASTYTFPVGHSTEGAQGFTIALTTGSSGSEILGYLALNNTSPAQTRAYCDLEEHPGGGTVNAGNGNAGYDGILDEIIFNLESPLQWDVTNPGGGISEYDLTVLANGGQDISPVTTANAIEVRYFMKNGEPGNAGVATGPGLPSFATSGFLACPNQYALTGLTSFSKFTLNGADQANTSLPVELLFFDAFPLGKSKVICTWATATEINNDFFTVERSIDGVNFSAIGVVLGAGNSNGELYYEFEDLEAYQGVSYYRLKQTDFDGTSSWSDIVVVRFDGTSASFGIFPSPFENQISIRSNSESEVSFVIFDLNGKQISKSNFVGSTSIDLARFASGAYFVKLSSTSATETIRILKK